jgi:hypothetical protein
MVLSVRVVDLRYCWHVEAALKADIRGIGDGGGMMKLRLGDESWW